MKDDDAMSGATSGRGGRPRRRLIADPSATRAAGRRKFREARRDHARNPCFDGKRRRAPMAPTDRWDEGLVYASRAGLIAPQSVKSLARQARGIRRRFAGSRGNAGPMRNADQAAELLLAIQFVKKVARRQGMPTDKPKNADVRDALELLFDKSDSEDAVKQRRQRLRRRLTEIRAGRPRR